LGFFDNSGARGNYAAFNWLLRHWVKLIVKKVIFLLLYFELFTSIITGLANQSLRFLSVHYWRGFFFIYRDQAATRSLRLMPRHAVPLLLFLF
jgi:hypothetical protein